jgi:hypothetical protein
VQERSKVNQALGRSAQDLEESSQVNPEVNEVKNKHAKKVLPVKKPVKRKKEPVVDDEDDE